MSGLNRWCFPHLLWDCGPFRLFSFAEDRAELSKKYLQYDFLFFLTLSHSLPIYLPLSFHILTSVVSGLEIGLIFKARVKTNCHPLEDK